MPRSESENLLVPFIKKNKGTLLLALLLLLGILLMLLPTASADEPVDEERRMSELCAELSGVGRCTVMLNKNEGEVVSAAVLCDGADSPEVELELKELLSTLLGIGYNRISVLKLSE